MGDNRASVELLRPLLQPKRKEKLSPQQEYEVVRRLSAINHATGAFMAALPLVQRGVVLAQQLDRPCSLQHAVALKGAIHRA